jgi:hypothetical protein
MKSTVDQLTNKERELLALFYDTETYKALKQLCKYEIDGLGQDALASPDHNMTRWYSGQATMATKLPKLIRELFKEKEDNKKQKS